MKNFTLERELNVVPYSELGKEVEGEKLSKDKWGVAEYKGQLIRCYVDPELIRNTFTNNIIENFKSRGVTPENTVRIADFGGGDGVLLNTITEQLAEAGYAKVLGVNIDLTKKRLDEMKSKYMEGGNELNGNKLYSVQGSLIEMPFKDETFDAGISRFVLQYFDKEKQPEIIGKMLKALKQGSELIIQWPIVTKNKEQASVANEFDSNVYSIMDGIPLEEAKNKRYLNSLEEIEIIAKELGIAHKISSIEDFKMYMSAEIYADRFNIKDEDKLKKLRDLFNSQYFKDKAKSHGGLNFIEDNGKNYIEYHVGEAVLKK